MSQTVYVRAPNIKNKAPNPVQITAEQLIQDGQLYAERQPVPQDVKIRDEQELEELKQIKRKRFEARVQKQRFYIGEWLKYAAWEERLQEFRRARSVYERALEVDYKNVSLWLKYINMEMRHKFVNHARNLFERAVDVLPRVDQLWYKYAFMEELMQNYVRARDIFERWMEWEPNEKAWNAYFQFEGRMHETEKQQKILLRLMEVHPKLGNYLKAARFEVKAHNINAARKIFERTLEELGQEALQEEYFIQFTRFEIRFKETDRAREIFKFGLENIPKEQSKRLYEEYLQFEKQHGRRDEIDQLVFAQRRQHYKQLLARNKMNYDAWFDLVNLEVATGHIQRSRETFEAAVAVVPPHAEKRYWRRYIYLWYAYATFEEVDAGDMQRANEVYQRALKAVPHTQFTFSKLWVMYAHFALRCCDVERARKIFGHAIGKCANARLFNEYIEMELQLANIERVREIYKRYVELFPDSPQPWIKWAELERSLEEVERCRGIFELAVQNENLSQPETVWRAYIDNEIANGEYEQVRSIYERLLARTKHVKIWTSFAQFEASIDARDSCRALLQRAEDYFKNSPELKEERAMLLETWRDIELKFGEPERIEEIKKRLPLRVKKLRKMAGSASEAPAPQPEEEGGDGSTTAEQQEEERMEEYYDYVFPGDAQARGILKIQERALLWKKQQQELQKQQ